MSLIFFDIDYTLCLKGIITEDNEKVLKELKAKGHKLGISTGRSLMMLPQDISKLIDENVFSTLVCANGQYNLLEDRLISHFPLTRAEADYLISQAQRFNLVYQQAGNEFIALSEKLPRYDLVVDNFSCFVIDKNYHHHADIYQFSYVLRDETFIDSQIKKELAEKGFDYVPWAGLGADVIRQGCSKFKGICDVAGELHIDIKDIIAFGDGLNDLEMISGVGLGIAMGNAYDEVKALAKYTTDTIENNGIRKACEHFGLL